MAAYSALPQCQNSSCDSSSADNVDSPTLTTMLPVSGKRLTAIALIITSVQIVLFSISASMLYAAYQHSTTNNHDCLFAVSAWSPGLEAVKYETRIFEGSLYHNSPWKGEPRPELDALWHRVGQVGAMSISAEEVRRLGKDPDYVVKWPPDLGGGHVVSVETFHHLHCLVSCLRRNEASAGS